MTTSRKETTPALSASEARSNFNDLVNRVQYGGERVTVTRQGKPAAVMISVADLELLERLEDRLWGDLALERLKEEKRSGAGRIDWQDLKRNLGL
ncbi:type II toxin-antitoxin system Phd/YefM family antitoxin [Deinococcus aestuarii]|uniref:type II toxin-antitoxin system Phd/YefM family antitoxin n=1 Tax=Deinococcus aestuarii TaxID=2774531 RepID=UPI001C0BE93E|nr:type II toxin-antitoxin system Phd/YefM family antitoxin [Deinococcus aestuarii]